MGSGEVATCSPSSQEEPTPISDPHEKHRLDLENLSIMTQPLKTMQLFILATAQQLRQLVTYLLTMGGWFMLVYILAVAIGFLVLNVNGNHEKHLQEFIRYSRYILWWVSLGVASSVGLGSGLHTFVLYLGPHIALFTIKAMKCGRADLKSAPYDTIQLQSGPSWFEKDCSAFGPPLYSSNPDSLVRVPLSSILPQVQVEAVLWGIGTALGELPPYFIARAARLSGSKCEDIEELNAASSEGGLPSAFLKKSKAWLLSHSQQLNFSTILVLASVPNPLFDLAGIMCGQFGIPFWKFFLATLFGKAIIKTHIQTAFVILLCNNQLLEWMENKLIRILVYVPGLSSTLPNFVAKLHVLKEKYLSTSVAAPTFSEKKAKQWNLSLSMIWNTVVWLMLLNFVVKIVTTTAQTYLKKQQELEYGKNLTPPNEPNSKMDVHTDKKL